MRAHNNERMAFFSVVLNRDMAFKSSLTRSLYRKLQRLSLHNLPTFSGCALYTILIPIRRIQFFDHAAPHQYIRWIREGDVLMDTREPDLLPPARIELDGNGNLRVANVRNSDTGEYVCEVMTPHGLATQVHAIEVQCKYLEL